MSMQNPFYRLSWAGIAATMVFCFKGDYYLSGTVLHPPTTGVGKPVPIEFVPRGIRIRTMKEGR
ncbi:hypothetical protein PDESU_04814 [Pontiella desulfatans]|uniref:Uncharacterized protein n=1 Tax=Pontiella desulfatans TaxID=2750659 RepID=A0A6C2U8R3_PONDE|nr:hypothetical protein PDESU_04814 [Pontiella desulfatans]